MSVTRTRKRLGAVLVAAGVLTAAACSAPPTTGVAGAGREGTNTTDLPTCPLDALAKAKGKVKVQLWYGGIVQPTSGVLTDLVKKFNASQDKVEVVANNQGVEYDEVLDAFNKKVSTPEQLPQMVLMEDIQLGKMVDSNTVMPAASCMKADGYDPRQISAAARATYSVDGVLYPAYMNVSTPVIYYNKAHFEKAGLDPNRPPQTLDEIIADAKVIKEKGVAPKPFAFKADQWFFNTWLAGEGYDVFDNGNGRLAPATKADLTAEEPVALMDKLAGMKKDGLMNAFPKTAGNIDHYLALVTGESSMVIETSTASSTIAQVLGGDIDTSDAGEAGIDVSSLDLTKIGVVPGSGEMPGVNAAGQIYASGAAFYMLNAGGKGGEATDEKIAASWEFMKFMLQPENAKEWTVVGGYLPVVKKVAEDKNVQKFFQSNLQGILMRPAVQQLTAADPDRSARSSARSPRTRTPSRARWRRCCSTGATASRP
jgi:sn-glycerol 3-phosphate transport system substrate-binding protein